MEEKIEGKSKGRIPEWAFEYARERLTRVVNIDFSIFDKILEDHQGKAVERSKPPEPNKPVTEEEILALAKEVSEFSSAENYEASLPPMEFTIFDRIKVCKSD